MTYYKRRKAVLDDDLLQSMLTSTEDQLAKLPVEKRDAALRKLMKGMSGDLLALLEKIKDSVIAESREDVKRAIAYDNRQRKGFEKRLYESHRGIIDVYAEMLGVCVEAMQSYREITHNTWGEKDTVLPVVLRLQARVHRIANEILALVRAGYGTGALSRWRSMHETVVVMAYLIEKGPKAIKAMQDHQAISDYKAMKDYQTYCEQLGELPYSSYEMTLARRKYDRRIRHYGRNFKKDYGWVSVLTPSITDFRNLEKHVGIDHLRPYYKLSSLGVHMEWNSLLMGEEFEALQNPGIVLIGPADYGFEDAISLSLITAAHATTLILTYNLSMKSLMYACIIRDIQQRAEVELTEMASRKIESKKSSKNS